MRGMDYNALAELLFPNVKMTTEDIEKLYPPRELKEGAVVSRMAPSPTGFVHLGNLVQGMTSERLAHQSGGVLFLRVEDTDQKREVPGAVEVLIDVLKHYGIVFDEGATKDGDSGAYGPYRQRQRKDIYHVYAKKLVREGKAYPCFCTEEELAAMHEQQAAEKANFGYYGKWAKFRDCPLEEIERRIAAGEPWVLRFRSDGNIENKIKFTDQIKGALELTENDIDHVLLKSDGIPTYHFAHAVDDTLMHTTHVVRGDECLPSLRFHIQLFRALGKKLPKYLHIGTLQKMDGESKRKLSKRKDPELALTYYQQEGYPVKAVYEYILTILNSNFEDWRRANPDADTDEFKFSAKKMNPAGSLFDVNKLRDVSKNIIAKMSAEEVYELACEWAKEYDREFYELLAGYPEYSKEILAIGRGGKKPRKDIAIWKELRGYMDFFFEDIFEPEYVYPENMPYEDIESVLREYPKYYSPDADQTAWFDMIKVLSSQLGYCPETKEYKKDPGSWKGHVGDISMVLRVAVCGRQQSPDMFAVMKIMGPDMLFYRLERANEYLKDHKKDFEKAL